MQRGDRRDFLKSAIVASAATVAWPAAAAPKRAAKAPAALLLPLTGASAAIGLGIQRAVALTQPVDAKDPGFLMIDTGSTAEGAKLAAQQAIGKGARIILGPLHSEQTRAVVAVAGSGFPILSFSNDEALIGGGAFLLGVTARQSISAILAYARRRGVRRVVAFGGNSPWAQQGWAAARQAKDGLGIELTLLPAPLPESQSLTAALRGIGKGELPDALLVIDGGDALAQVEQALGGSDVQLIGGQPAGDAKAVAGSWVAGADPAALADFVSRYQARYGSIPGNLAALAYDGATIVQSLRAGGVVDRPALASASLAGVMGALRFRADGSAMRELAILVAGESGYTVVDKSAAT